MPVQTQIQQRRGTAASWTSTNPTLAAGETGYETDTGKFKIGNGSTAWASLAYATNGAVVSPLTTKGDLFTYSTTNARLAVGANGETLVADSSTSTGLRYQPSISQNFVINGNFDIWQRGTSFVSPSGYTADRWTSGGGLNATVAQEATTIQDGSTYSLKITSTGAGSYQQLITYLESGMVNALAGKTIVLSAYVRANATFSGTLELKMSTGTLADTTGGTWTSAATQTVTPTTSGWTRVQTSYTVPSGTKGLRFELNYVTGQANGSIVYWSQVQAEIGSVPTVFKRSGGTIQGELSAAQRYCLVYSSSSNNYAPMATGHYYSTVYLYAHQFFPVEMRVAPSVTFTAASNFGTFSAGTNRACSNMASDAITTKVCGIIGTTSAATAGNGGWLGANGSTGATITWSAEL
jgi:hypothetical protein